MGLLAEAIAFAAEAHLLQEDKGGNPYILHPLDVMHRLRQDKRPETVQAVGVLHDVVEDTEYTLEDIHARFGEVVTRGVDAMTRRKNPDTGEWAETHREYIERCLADPIGFVVKEADTHSNMDPKRFCDGVPIGRYVKVLQRIAEIRREAQEAADHGVFR